MNYQPVQAHSHTQLELFCAAESLPRLDLEAVSQQQAAAHWMLTGPGGQPVARCDHFASRAGKIIIFITDIQCQRLYLIMCGLKAQV